LLLLCGNAYLTFTDTALDIPPGFLFTSRQDQPKRNILGILFFNDKLASVAYGAEYVFLLRVHTNKSFHLVLFSGFFDVRRTVIRMVAYPLCCEYSL